MPAALHETEAEQLPLLQVDPPRPTAPRPATRHSAPNRAASGARCPDTATTAVHPPTRRARFGEEVY
jgi:hypothetical protein